MNSYTSFGNYKLEKQLPIQWQSDYRTSKAPSYKNLCLVSVIFAFSVGLTIGILIPLLYFNAHKNNNNATRESGEFVYNSQDIKTIFINNSYGAVQDNKGDKYDTVSFVKDQIDVTTKDIHSFNDAKYVENGIYWGTTVENALPNGYRDEKHAVWSDYIEKAVAVRLENGCGRMQNRLVTFQDGLKGCVRYRQNTDQIQGELFSFYLAQILKLPNLAPSAISVVDLASSLWEKLRNEIASAQWSSNRPIVITQFIGNLNNANIPNVFKPLERHLNELDIINMTKNNLLDRSDLIRNLVELAQWSDLIIFDYLTANLDRIVNNLYNYQWNVNIMDAPAHNLARKSDNDLLVFLDNESGLLHGYRLLKKYEVYHSVLLDNLCVFRKSTAEVIKRLYKKKNVGVLLREMFERKNSASVRDILPTIPDKSVKILNDRIQRVYEQIKKCEAQYGNRN